jgi:GNAT superfamily N-acetyltransferase
VEAGCAEAERTELEATRDMFAAADSALSLGVDDLGGAVVFTARTVPAVLFNRALGLGVFAPASRAEAAAVTRQFAERGVHRYLVHLPPTASPPRLRDWLGELGLAPFRRSWAKFSRGDEPVADAETSLRVEAIGPECAADFARITIDGYGLPPTAAGMLRPLVGRPRWHVYLSYAGDRPAGTGVMFVDGEVGWLGWGATEPEHRGRGSQRALLARRLRDALALGCRRFYVELGESVPGEPQSSYQNILRAGFTRAYVRDNLCPA